MRRLLPALLISTLLLFGSIWLLAGPTSAQEPESTPPKGPETPPILEPAPPGPDDSGETLDGALLRKIEPQLLKKLLTGDSEAVPFIAYLRAKTDLTTAASTHQAQTEADPLARRTAIVAALQQTAHQSQAGLLQTLLTPPPGALSGQSIAAADIRPLWIVNAVAAKGNLAMLLALAARPDVELIRLDKEIKLNDQLSISNSQFIIHNSQFTTPQPEWGIAKIRADLVQTALGIDGRGVVVANIDSGVDWLHPALQRKYRGYTGPGHLPLHLGNWHDATGLGAAYPVDSYGHGTHTMGTMVGDFGLGVAPGAQWIAVRAFDSSGGGLNSWLHAAFQWVLAPNGNPALAPHIVNNSWGSDFGASTEFEADVTALLSAGILPIFSAGNNGPAAGTVGSPGSYNNAFAVGATTIDDEIALFSSRGPSPWGKIKPEVTAPGKDVRSTIPGGSYATYQGTSMAAPHAAGLAALLLQASPALSNNLSNITRVMTSTAVPLGSPIPNNDYGWGRIDAYNAVMAVAPVGTLQGRVTRAGNGAAISNAAVQITRRSSPETTLNVATNAAGNYLQGLAAGAYDATASAFGFESATVFNLAVITGAATSQDFALQPKPVGTLQGTVRETGSNNPLMATITIDGAPASTLSGPNGNYNLGLPIGVYTVTVTAPAHRVAKAANITIHEGETVTQNFWLAPAPAILLVDSGRWYQESQIGYYQQALADLLYPYDTWSISAPFSSPNDIPTAADLARYDIVIWSAPLDSPGYIGADEALADFLDGGGKLLLSGQDVAYFDGGGSFFGSAAYFRNYLKARFLRDDAGVDTVTGVADQPLAGLSLTLTGGDGADNQLTPDVVAISEPDFAAPLLTYAADDLAGLQVDRCVPYRATFLGFGFEAINSRGDRSEVLGRTLDWLQAAPPAAGLELTPPGETRVGAFGAVVSHTVRLRNTGATTDTYRLAFNSAWPYRVEPAGDVVLGSCQTRTITMAVTVNTTAWHSADTLTVTARSAADPTITATATRTTKSPAPLLLVDDDRWYSFAAEYKASLEANQVAYDYWLVPKSWTGTSPPSPPLATLQLYPLTVWYTAYDWFQPLTLEEENRLAAYLDGGGRLLFSSQDYLYNQPNRQPGPFARNYLGVLGHIEDFSSTLTIGEPGSPVGHRLGPYPLTFPLGYNNWTDALTPTATAQIASRGQADQPNALTQAGVGPTGRNWRTNFMAYGFELLAPADRNRLMQRAVGWLSWLGRSTVTPSISAALAGETVVYTATLINDGWDDLATAYFTATRPTELSWETFSPALTLVGDELRWSGPLAQNEARVFTYSATIADPLPIGTLVEQTSWLAYPEHNIHFDRIAVVQVNFPNLSSSRMRVTPAQDVEAGDILTYTIVLRNDGLVDAPAVTTTNSLPHPLELLTVDGASQGNVEAGAKTLTWTTPLTRGGVATLTYRAVISYRAGYGIDNVAYATDGYGDPVRLTARAAFKVGSIYLPLIFKN